MLLRKLLVVSPVLGIAITVTGCGDNPPLNTAPNTAKPDQPAGVPKPPPIPPPPK